MAGPFLALFYYFDKRPRLFWGLLCVLVLSGIFLVSKIKIDQDISSFFPDSEESSGIKEFLQYSKEQDQLIFILEHSQKDPDALIDKAKIFIPKLDSILSPHLLAIKSELDDQVFLQMHDSLLVHLPIYLEEEDYHRFSQFEQPDYIKTIFEEHYKSLNSPVDFFTQTLLKKDPLQLSVNVLGKLRNAQMDSNFTVHENFIFSRQLDHLFLFASLKQDKLSSQAQKDLVIKLDELCEDWSKNGRVRYFGALAVAVGNATQVDRDMKWCLGIFVVSIFVILLYYFEKKRIPFLILIPVGLGFLFSMVMVYFWKGQISMLAIACGSMILGIAVNYSLHIVAHFKKQGNIEQIIRDVTAPMLLGSATTILAFYGLQWTSMPLLREIGFFAGNCLLVAALSSLIVLPQCIKKLHYNTFQNEKKNYYTNRPFAKKLTKIVFVIIAIGTVFFYIKTDEIRFNSNLGSLNYMTDSLRNVQFFLEEINKSSLSSTYIISSGKNMNSALVLNERQQVGISNLLNRGLIVKTDELSSFLISDSLQQLRINRWNLFWTKERKAAILKYASENIQKFSFHPSVLSGLQKQLEFDYGPVSNDNENVFRKNIWSSWITEDASGVRIMRSIKPLPHKEEECYTVLDELNILHFDRQNLVNQLLEKVKVDFSFIVIFTSLLVFFILWLNYGRIELTIISFAPMALTWIWILGIMAIWQIEFNMINVMMSTFIFGLGDDFSIFTMDRLLKQYKYKNASHSTSKESIFLSALTTLVGLGVLLFAQHPALRSIASVAVIGTVSVYMMSQFVQPVLFDYIITRRTVKGKRPMTLKGMIFTFVTFGYYTLSSIFLGFVGFLFSLIPFVKKKTRWVYHCFICYTIRFLIFIAANLTVRKRNFHQSTFDSPKLIICNHSSFLDILFVLMLHPKLILLTNKWVWNSPIFGAVVRFAGYYPVDEGAEGSIDFLKQMVDEGYSIVIFPEGTRSLDGQVKRFHKGAFYISDKLQLPIQPLIIIGAHDAIPKYDIYLNDTDINIHFLPAIEISDFSYGDDYHSRAKNISKYYKSEWKRIKNFTEDVHYFIPKLISNYIYKGPVLEWYARIKIKLEHHYQYYNSVIHAKGNILDLGCGYGFLDHLLSWVEPERTITAIDMDEEKINVAKAVYSKTQSLEFFTGDIVEFPFERYDVILLLDVLHYLTPEHQHTILEKCISSLLPKGIIIIREGNSDNPERQKNTRCTEWFSVNLLGFNKSKQGLYFLSETELKHYFEAKGFNVKIHQDSRITSNTSYLISQNLL